MASGASRSGIAAKTLSAHARQLERRVAASAPERPVAVARFGPAPEDQKPERIDVVAHNQPRNRIADYGDQCGVNRTDRKSDVEGKSVSVRVDLGGLRNSKK